MPTYELRIDGTAVPLGPGVQLSCSLVRYELSYDGPAELVLRFITNWRTPPFATDAVVEFLVDGVRRFSGLFDPSRPYVADVNEHYVEYTAVDLCEYATRMFPFSQYGKPSFTLSPGPLESVLAQYMLAPEVALKLTEVGIDTTFGFAGGAEAIECLPVSLESASLDAALRQIASAAAGAVGVMLDCTQPLPRYTFVNLYGSDIYDLVIDSSLLEKLDLPTSIEGRCGAVLTLAGQTTGSADVEESQRFELSPAWPREPRELLFGEKIYPEQEWTIRDASVVIKSGMPPNETVEPGPRALVYRLYSFASAATPPNVNSSPTAEIHINTDADGANGLWKRIEIQSIDYDRKLVLLKEPAIASPPPGSIRYNPHEPGRAKGARVQLAWSTAATGSAQINIPSIRFPASGYAGKVVAMAPKRGRTVKLISVPPGVNRAAYAQYAHQALSEPLVRGEVPIRGPLPTELWGLARRVNIRSAQHGPTGKETLEAPVKGIRVAFERGGSAQVQLSRDTAALVDGGAS